MFDMFVVGFAAIMSVKTILLIALGVVVGIIFGAIPGLTATMAVALVLPITYGLGPVHGMAILLSLYIGGISGGLIAAVLIKIPGTPSSIATTFDGSPMAERGEAGRALGIGVFFSFLGGLIGFVALFFIAPPLAKIALKFSPIEYFAIAIFSLTMIASLSGKSLTKGLGAGIIGVLLSCVGAAPIDAFSRYTFGIHSLEAGFNLLPALIGLFAVSEILKTAEADVSLKDVKIADFKIKGFGVTMQEFKEQFVNMVRSSVIGTGVGILPGVGSGISNILAYLAARNSSKHPEKFGTGCIDGLVASESSNNATIGGALVPLLTLGIPGDTVTAMLLGGLMIHGIAPGPLLFQTNGDIVYAIFATLIVGNVFMLIAEYFGMRLFVRLLRIPKYYLLPAILTLCVVGSYGVNNRVFDVATILIFGILGYVMSKFGFPLPPVILGFILGPIAETNLRRGLMFTEGSFLPFLTSPIAAGFFIVAIYSAVSTVIKNKRREKRERETLQTET